MSLWLPEIHPNVSSNLKTTVGHQRQRETTSRPWLLIPVQLRRHSGLNIKIALVQAYEKAWMKEEVKTMYGAQRKKNRTKVIMTTLRVPVEDVVISCDHIDLVNVIQKKNFAWWRGWISNESFKKNNSVRPIIETKKRRTILQKGRHCRNYVVHSQPGGLQENNHCSLHHTTERGKPNHDCSKTTPRAWQSIMPTGLLRTQEVYLPSQRT